MQNWTFLGPICPKKSDCGPKSEKIGPFGKTGLGLMSVGEGSRGEGISLCVKFKTSRMLSSGIFWWGSSCYRGKTKSTPSLKLKLGLWTGV